LPIPKATALRQCAHSDTWVFCLEKRGFAKATRFVEWKVPCLGIGGANCTLRLERICSALRIRAVTAASGNPDTSSLHSNPKDRVLKSGAELSVVKGSTLRATFTTHRLTVRVLQSYPRFEALHNVSKLRYGFQKLH
jgi:hypothetical protein